MAQQIRRIDPFSAAKVAAILYGIMGLVFIPFVLVLRSLVPAEAAEAGFAPGFGIGFAIVMPVVYACVGFVFTFIGAALYNVVAGWVGGVEVELG